MVSSLMSCFSISTHHTPTKRKPSFISSAGPYTNLRVWGMYSLPTIFASVYPRMYSRLSLKSTFSQR